MDCWWEQYLVLVVRTLAVHPLVGPKVPYYQLESSSSNYHVSTVSLLARKMLVVKNRMIYFHQPFG